MKKMQRMIRKIRKFCQAAPEETGVNPRYDKKKDVVVSTTQTPLDNNMVGERTVANWEHPRAAEIFAWWLAKLPESHLKKKDLEVVIAENRNRRSQALKLNVRAGKIVFAGYSNKEIFEQFRTALQGARRIAEISQMEALALPILDENLVAEVLRGQPDTIEVMGETLSVHYGETYDPSVYLTKKVFDKNLWLNYLWLNLPDKGVRLPNGRLVYVTIGNSILNADSNIPRLKKKIQARLNLPQWNRWEKEEKPKFNLSHQETEFEIPFISIVYGECVITGNPLTAYGTVVPNYQKWLPESFYFKEIWIQEDEGEARRIRAETAQILEAIRVEKRLAQELKIPKESAQNACHKLWDLYNREGWQELSSELRNEVGNRWSAYLPDSVEGLCKHRKETEALIASVEAELKKRDT